MNHLLRLKMAAMVAAICLCVGISERAGAQLSSLTGHVTVPAGMSGPVTVILLSAAKSGIPDSNADGGHLELPRRTRSDAAGNFTFPGLATNFSYVGVVMAPNCRPAFLDHVVPGGDSPNLELKVIDTSNAPKGTIVRGRVENEMGKPMEGAFVRVGGVTRGDSTTWPALEVDGYAVTDDAGRFMVYATNPVAAIEGAVSAPGFATSLFTNLRPGDEAPPIRLGTGAAVAGTLPAKGSPVPNAQLRLDHFGPESGSWFWNTTAFTDTNGHFLFEYLPPDRRCRLRGATGELSLGVVPETIVTVPAVGVTSDLGTINLDPAYKIAGKVILSDGRPIPQKSRVAFGDFDVGMSGPSRIHEDGSFTLAGVPAKRVTLYLRVPGYERDANDRRMKAGTSTNLTVTADVTNFNIVLHPSSR